jgi:hypothetical protein
VVHLAPAVPQPAPWVPDWHRPSTSQQPASHERGVQVQSPDSHSRPPVHEAHGAPPLPHLGSVSPAWQTGATPPPPSQQPAHVLVSQTQPTEATHARPAPHAAPPSQPQPPSARQVFDCTVRQLLHAAPPAPHAPGAVPGRQLRLPSQQPDGQLLALQPQRLVAPLTSQSCPGAHGGPELQPQPPSAAHSFATRGSQVTHGAPDFPQPPSVRHAPSRQQPLEHDAGEQPVQAPASQLCPEGQVWQPRPLTPHAAAVLPALQPPSERQQPFGQLAESQTQVVPVQRVPAAQAGAPPHRHWPSEQRSAPAPQSKQVPASKPQLRGLGGSTQVGPS